MVNISTILSEVLRGRQLSTEEMQFLLEEENHQEEIIESRKEMRNLNKQISELLVKIEKLKGGS